MAPTSLLRADQLTCGYRGRVVLEGIDADLKSGQFVCLLGANGTGKSTLLRTLAGLQASLDGGVLLLGDPLTSLPGPVRAKRLALVLTDRLVAQSMTAYDLVALGRQPHTGWTGRLNSSDRDAIDEALTDANAQALASRPLIELSDGERQRVLIARALAQRPKVIILDEPTAFLDLPRRIELMEMLRRLARQRDLGILLSTHDLDLAIRYADELWLLDGKGRLSCDAPEDAVLNGRLEAAFLHDGMSFDLEHGSLHRREAHAGAVAVDAPFPHSVWLTRAASRAGFRSDITSPLRITSCNGVNTVHSGNREIMASSKVGDVVDALRSLAQP